MNTGLNLFEISKHGHITQHIWAKTGTAAKRCACSNDGIKPNDYWCGLSTYSARKMSAAEIVSWEAAQRGMAETYTFIAGAMEMFSKIYKEATS